jgi:adenylosuccinate lyase
MDIFGGVIFSQAVLLKLIDQGLTREQAYQLVQTNAMKAWNHSDGNFKSNLQNDSEVLQILSKEEIDKCFSSKTYLRNIDVVFKKLGI